MTDFKPYPTYKDSGVEWLGEVPEHWEIRPFYSLLQERRESNQGLKENNLLSLSYGNIVKRDINSLEGLLPASYETYQIVHPTDIVFRLTDLQNDKRSLRSAIVKEKGIITSAYLAAACEKINSHYANYLFRAYDLTKVFYSMGGGLRQSMKFSDMKRLEVLSPPLKEQTQIARFLDHETTRMDALIAEQERLIELLKEKRQAVISHAVTKGLNPNVPMKDSGVEWVGEVPEHWSIIPLKHVITLNPQKSEYKGRQDILCSFVPMEKLKMGTIQLDEYRTVSDVFHSYTYFENNDVLQAKVTPCFENKNVAIAEGLENGLGFGSSEINVLRPSESISRTFLFYRVQEDNYMSFCTASMLGAGGLKRVPTDIINNFKVGLPGIEEQTQIARFLDQETTKLDALITEAQHAISLIKERRSALISAAVTGKIDVRNWQPEAEQKTA